ncbi:DUF3299 domain-containing protein [Adhaeretor mobilis]|nr:DUF3299 domain-containing protein [Adhaeretor mobilis]
MLLIASPMLAGCSDSSGEQPSYSTTEATAEDESPVSELDKAKPKSQVARSTRIQDKTFDDIKFEMEKTDPFKRSLFTPEIEALFGGRIRIRGYMLPTPRSEGLTEFVLMRDNLECCFGPGAALFDCILVTMKDGKTAKFSTRPIAVEGTFRFQEFMDPVNGSHLAIYALDGEAVK